MSRQGAATSAVGHASSGARTTANVQSMLEVREEQDTSDSDRDSIVTDGAHTAGSSIFRGSRSRQTLSKNRVHQDALAIAIETLKARDEYERAERDASASVAARGAALAGGENNADLIELYRTHSRRTVAPDQLKAAILESLRAEVRSLDDDKWIYEVESEVESPA